MIADSSKNGRPRGSRRATFAALQANAEAQYNLGWMSSEGSGVQQYSKQAVAWYRKAAEQGLPIAQAALAGMYTEGRGVEKNDKQADEWGTKAAKEIHVNNLATIEVYFYLIARRIELALLISGVSFVGVGLRRFAVRAQHTKVRLSS